MSAVAALQQPEAMSPKTMASQAILPRADTACSPSKGQGPAHFHYDSTDVHEYGANLKCWSLDYDQLSRGAFRGSLTAFRLPRIEIFREVTSLRTRQRGTLGAGSFTVGVPWAETAVAHCNGACVSGPDSFLVSLDAEFELFTPDDFEVRGVSASARMMEELAGELDVAWPPHDTRQMLGARAEPQHLARFRRLLQLAHASLRERSDLEADTPAMRALEDSLLVAVLDLVATSTPVYPSAAERRRTVDRARELMLSLDGKAMTLIDVCREVGASPSKLTYCFRDQLGVSPGSYWKVIRLNRARRDLLQCAPDGTDIYSIAARHGFWHFSQFSQDYKRHFVERPSETVRNARSRRVLAAAL